MPENGTLSEIKAACAQIELVRFATKAPGIKTFAHMPPKASQLTPPYSYRIFALSEDLGNTDTDAPIPSARRIVNEGELSPQWRAHTLWGCLMLGELADQWGGLPALDAMASDWVDLIYDTYRANVTLLGTASRSMVLRIKPYKDAYLGTKHFGLLYTVQAFSHRRTLTTG